MMMMVMEAEKERPLGSLNPRVARHNLCTLYSVRSVVINWGRHWTAYAFPGLARSIDVSGSPGGTRLTWNFSRSQTETRRKGSNGREREEVIYKSARVFTSEA